MSEGYLELIIGPMYAGKSTELIRKKNLYTILGKRILPVNHSMNDRYGDSTEIITHNKKKIKDCMSVENLSDISEEQINNSDVIIIDELQFFQDAFIVITYWVEKLNKTVIASGLDGDFNKNPFGDVLKLIPYSNKVRKLSALCRKCGDGTLAHFTKRKTTDIEKTIIGSTDVYESVCRKHYSSKGIMKGSPNELPNGL